jgi:small-conductance mechanosensitive channel
VAAAIAIVSKDFVSPVIGGLIVAISKDLSIGDVVRIGDHRGKIVDLSLTKIALLNEDNDRIYIPNDKAYLSEIVNYSRGDLHRVSIPFELDPGSVGTVEELEANLIKALIPYNDEIVQDSFTLRIVEIRKDSIALKFQYTLDRIDPDLEKEIKRRTVRRVLNYITNRSTASREGQMKKDGI